MRRALALSTESARHPFRRALPAHLFRLEAKEAAPARPKRASSDQDWKLFLLSFAAFFTAFYTFIV
jgi:hypothetical protein